MNKRNAIASIMMVALSNAAVLLAGVLVGFLLPKMISVEDYGFYKTFTLYANYIGLFSLGIIDGIVLRYGGYDYCNVEKELFRGYFKFYLLIHIIFALFIIISANLLLSGEDVFIFTLLGFFLISNNITGYFQQISQITQRFKEFSSRTIIQSSLNIAVLCALFFIYRKGVVLTYKPYLLSWVAINYSLTSWYIYTYQDIIFGPSVAINDVIVDIKQLIRIGFPLLLSNLCATLILTLDRQFVNLLFSNSEYAIYAFAYNMLSLVTVATSAISTVLYPFLKRTTKETLKENYPRLISILLSLVYGALIVFFPLSAFVGWFLPKYIESIIIFRIVFPGLAISSTVTVIMHNYYKTLGNNLLYFKKCVAVLVISAIANGAAFLLFRNTVSISVASIITMIIWYIYTEQFFVIEYKCSRIKNLSYIIIMMGAFYIISSFENWFLMGICYLLVYIICTMIMQKKELSWVIKGLKTS